MKEFNIALSHNDVGQLLDGLDVLIEQWDATVEYLETGITREDVCIRESHNSSEAKSIANIYQQLRDQIREQVPAAK